MDQALPTLVDGCSRGPAAAAAAPPPPSPSALTEAEGGSGCGLPDTPFPVTELAEARAGASPSTTADCVWGQIGGRVG